MGIRSGPGKGRISHSQGNQISDDLTLNILSLRLVPEHDSYRWSDDVVRDLRRTYSFFPTPFKIRVRR